MEISGLFLFVDESGNSESSPCNQGQHVDLCVHTVFCIPVRHYEHNRAHLILGRAHSMGFCSTGFTDNDRIDLFHPSA